MSAALARFAPRWPIYVTSAVIAHRHATALRERGCNDNWLLEPWQ
jgi:hypothetical protein